MKAIILAAGQGKRLLPLTNSKPKCMIDFMNKSIIEHIIATMKNCGIHDITIVTGYKKKIIENSLANHKIKFYQNNKFKTTNMVYTFFCALKEFNDDIIISYSDIIYSKRILRALIKSDYDISVIVDNNWKTLWHLRMGKNISDFESMKFDSNKNIIELGKKTNKLNEVQGQYIGLIKFKKNALSKIAKFYNQEKKSKKINSNKYNNMYMTDFLQLIIEKLLPIKAIIVKNGWIEIDTTQDLSNYNKSIVSVKKLLR